MWCCLVSQTGCICKATSEGDGRLVVQLTIVAQKEQKPLCPLSIFVCLVDGSRQFHQHVADSEKLFTLRWLCYAG